MKTVEQRIADAWGATIKHGKTNWLMLEQVVRDILQRVARNEVYASDDCTRYRQALVQIDEAIAAFTGRGNELEFARPVRNCHVWSNE